MVGAEVAAADCAWLDEALRRQDTVGASHALRALEHSIDDLREAAGRADRPSLV